MKTRSMISLLSVVLAMGCSRAEKSKPAQQPADTFGSIERLAPALDAIVPPNAKVERVADGFGWTEGPVWTHNVDLLFSAMDRNSIMKWVPGKGVSAFSYPGGNQGANPPAGLPPSSNGLTLDQRGRLTVAGNSGRDIYRFSSLTPGAKLTVLADRYHGKRLNSPNDLVYKSDGSLYFTDPPYGLPKGSKQELPFSGVYRLPGAGSLPDGAPPANRKLQLVIKDLTRPNGIAFSPDEKFLYIAVSDSDHMVWMRYDVKPDGSVANGAVFCTATSSEGDGVPDGIKVDQDGNLYGAGPGGLWIISREGKHIGTVKLPERAANCAWGDADGKTLYITASSSVYRVRLKVAGVRP